MISRRKKMFWVLDDDRVEVINAGFTKQINTII